MAAEKSPLLFGLEQSLINYLFQKKEVEEKVSGGRQRIKNLNLNLDMKNPKQPCISVQIGMFEVVFDAKLGYRVKGSCYGIERIIGDWLQRASVQADIKSLLDSHK